MRSNNEILEEIIDTIKGVDTSVFVNVENIVPVPSVEVNNLVEVPSVHNIVEVPYVNNIVPTPSVHNIVPVPTVEVYNKYVVLPTINNYVNIDCSVGQIVDALDRIADKIEKPLPKPYPCPGVPCDIGQNQNIYAKYFDELFYQTRGKWLGMTLYF